MTKAKSKKVEPVETKVQPKKRVLRPAFEIGEEVMVKKPSKIHRNYMGATGHVVSVNKSGSGYRVMVKLIIPDKQRPFAASELVIHRG